MKPCWARWPFFKRRLHCGSEALRKSFGAPFGYELSAILAKGGHWKIRRRDPGQLPRHIFNASRIEGESIDAITHQFMCASAPVRDKHRQPAGHRLIHDQAPGLHRAGMYESASKCVISRKVGDLFEPGHRDVIAETERISFRFECGTKRTISEQDQRPRRLACRVIDGKGFQ